MPPVSGSAAQTQLERQQHSSERAAPGAEHDSCPDVCGANVGLHGGRGRFLPLPANLSQKSCARRTSLSQPFVAAVTVVADRRRANKNPRLLLRPRQSRRQIQRPGHAAVVNLPLLGRAPSSENTFAGKVNHGVKSRHRFGRNCHCRIPRNLPTARSRAPHQPHHSPSTGSKGRKKRRPNRPRNPADQNSGIHDSPIATLPASQAAEQIADGFEIFEVPEKAHVETAASAVQGAKRRPCRMPVWLAHVERALLTFSPQAQRSKVPDRCRGRTPETRLIPMSREIRQSMAPSCFGCSSCFVRL